MFTVYLIQHTNTDQIYIGYTSNIEQRLENHNLNKVKSTSRKNGKWILIYSENFKSKHDAIIREKKLKHHGSSIRNLKNRISNSLFKNKN